MVTFDFEGPKSEGLSANVWDLGDDIPVKGSYDIRDSGDAEYLNLNIEARETKFWVSRIPELTTLRFLHMRSRPNQKLFEAICSLPNIERLVLEWTNITDLSPILKLSKLTHFALGSSPKLTNFEPLTKLTNLKTLWIQGTKKLPVDLDCVSSLVQLKGLVISGPNYDNQSYDSLNPLAKLTNLRFFGVATTKVGDKSLKFVSHFKRLKYLHIYDMKNWPLKEYENLYNLLTEIKCDNLKLAATSASFQKENGIR